MRELQDVPFQEADDLRGILRAEGVGVSPDDHAGHDVEKIAEDVNPIGGFPRDKWFCWTCGVGWAQVKR